jgi:histidine ammonia-lyase
MARKNTRDQSIVTLNADHLTIDDVVSVARLGARVRVGPKAIAAMKRSRAVVERCLKDGQAYYGINTGFGSLAKKRIEAGDLATLQRNLVRSHAAGVGEPLREEVVRAMMLILAASLSRGLSGVRPVVVETIVAMLNAGITPVVPSIGSVGASGDLAPLAHVALALIGEGTVLTRPKRQRGGAVQPIPAGAALKRAGITPLELGAKEGLALINGTHLMCAEGALLCEDFENGYDAALVALAMSIDACRASHSFLDPRLYAARGLDAPDGCDAPARLRALLLGSAIRESHRSNDPRVQDPYSLRAAPTVLEAAVTPWITLALAVNGELGAVTDNPLVFSAEKGGIATRRRGLKAGEPDIVSGANFHGMPLAIPLDTLAIALCHIAGISERRTYLMTGAFEPESRLKPFLAPRPGLQSGLMIAQYTAAACVNEMIGLAMPASVSNISTCAGMEDYNSFGPRSAAKARRSLELCRKVIAIELLCAAAGVECHRPLKSGEHVERAIKAIRKVVPAPGEDRPLTDDIEAIEGLIRSGRLTDV